MFVETSEKKVTQILVLLSFGLGLVGFFVLWPHFWLGIFLSLVIIIAGWSLPLKFVQNMFNKRCDKLVDQMVDGLTIMANGIKAGLSVPQTMERVVENLNNPISQEFNLVLSQIRLGRSVEEALLDLGERIPRPDVQMFVTAINILKETGGNLAETFSTIVVTIRERQKIEKKIEAMTAQGMMQGLIVSLVPMVLIILFFFIDPAFIRPMFNTPLGLFIFMMIIGLVIIGGVMMRKIVKIDV
jgi:tight adherence protein B